LISAAASNPDFYTRTDDLMYDEQGNLWILNMGVSNGNIHVVDSTGQWHSFDLIYEGNVFTLHTAGEMMVDKRNSQWKWIPILRYNTGLVLLQDNGTPTNPLDDKVYYRKEWMDQNKHVIAPEYIYCMAQDQNNTIWVGTSKGLFILRDHVNFVNSNACERIVIPRNDGTGLGDYLLENEQINSIVVDGANRIWIGTAFSGIYLMGFTESTEDADYTLEMIAHFTTENSLLPSDNILSVAIQESTGEVFIGTGAGLVSYMSDAIEPEENFTDLYAYPNPVRPNYRGSVVVKGLMADTDVRIVDAAGNLVKTIKGIGGEVVWDMTNTNGQRVASGVYTAICNTVDGKAAATTKILIMN
jgi:ligand-binding sensor domain-containing protein